MDIVRFLRYVISGVIVLGVANLSGQPDAGEVDVLAISHDFVSLPRALIVVVPVPQPAKSDGKLQIAENLGTIMTEELVGALRRELPTAQVVSDTSAPASAPGLVVETHFSRL